MVDSSKFTSNKKLLSKFVVKLCPKIKTKWTRPYIFVFKYGISLPWILFSQKNNHH